MFTIHHHYHHHYQNPPEEISKVDIRVLALLEQLVSQGKKIMSAISDYAARVSTKFDKIAVGIDGIKTDVDGLKAQIQALQNSPGVLSPADQQILDDLEKRADGLADRVTAVDAETETPPAP